MSEISKTVMVKDNEVKIRISRHCKYCGASMPERLDILEEGYTSNANGMVAEHGTYYMLLKCPFCESLLLRLYDARYDHKHMKFNDYGSEKKQSVKVKENVFSEIFKEISPRFISVYSQASQAEKKNLDELSGMGFRKALEILVKDYAIYKFPYDKEKIIRHSLQDALAKIDTHAIKVLGQVATKIGNDETHYYKKHDWKVSELKNYIESIIFFITSDLNYDQAELRLSEDRSQ